MHIWILCGCGAGRRDVQKPVSQKWCMIEDPATKTAVAVIDNGVYGADFVDGELGITLLRSAGYSASDFVMGKALQEEQWTPRMEQGERFYRFFVQGGNTEEVNEQIDRMALAFNEQPYGLSYCPPGEGKKAECLMKIDNTRVIVSALKKAEDTDGYVLRLYEGSGVPADAVISFPACQTEYVLHLNGFEIKTFLWKPQMGTLEETGLLEV